MSTFVIADLKLFDDKQRRKLGYPNFEVMNQSIISAWNGTVKEDDEVVIMGDLGQGDFDQMRGVISRLNGKLCWTTKNLGNFKKEEWKEIGFTFVWQDISLFKELDDGRIILYCIEPIRHMKVYRQQYCLLITDSRNPFEGMTKDIMLSADAAKWQYSPLNSDNLMDIYENMKEFEEMEDEEHRSDIKEEGE